MSCSTSLKAAWNDVIFVVSFALNNYTSLNCSSWIRLLLLSSSPGRTCCSALWNEKRRIRWFPPDTERKSAQLLPKTILPKPSDRVTVNWPKLTCLPRFSEICTAQSSPAEATDLIYLSVASWRPYIHFASHGCLSKEKPIILYRPRCLSVFRSCIPYRTVTCLLHCRELQPSCFS